MCEIEIKVYQKTVEIVLVQIIHPKRSSDTAAGESVLFEGVAMPYRLNVGLGIFNVVRPR